MFRKLRNSRRGFTLVELLTVVGIIALLISILLPSLAKARNQARRVKVSAQLDAIGKALEMFHNDFNGYPSSSARFDPIRNWEDTDGTGAPENDKVLYGAHWLARAMAGHDLQGVDAKGLVLKDGNDPANYVEYDYLKTAARKGVYLEGDVFARDTDGRFDQTGGPGTKRIIVFDSAWQMPIIYYRANTNARKMFSYDGRGNNDTQGSAGDMLGVYNMEDNGMIVGMEGNGWDFASKGEFDPAANPVVVHPMAQFGTLTPAELEDTEHEGSFVRTLHNHGAHEAAGILKPYNADSFILMAPGPDGRFGTDDDISNMK